MVSEEPKFSLKRLRLSQREVVEDYPGGRMGISAVPGSGKTHTLSFLAADLILGGNLDLNQEVLIVTMSNSAVENFTRRIGSLIQSEGLIHGLGYRVRTLHGLAHDIVRERPSLVSLANDFSIIDEREAAAIREQVATAWMRANPGFFDDYLDAELSEYQLNKITNRDLPRLVQGIALGVIRYAKDQEMTPEDLRRKLDALPAPLPLAEMGLAMYQEYQRSLAYRGAVDFDDLIRLALLALRTDGKLVDRLRHQWPYILEDEAQDSSRLQQKILELLSGDDGNWVRVGDPNQAIYETFTTANPEHLLSFINARGSLKKELPVSGRSTTSVIDLANYLIRWTKASHPMEAARRALHKPEILPTEPGDPQPNPPNEPEKIFFSSRKQTSAEEMDTVVSSLLRWQVAQDAKENDAEKETLAVLDLRNDRCSELADMLRKRGIEPVEITNSTSSTRLSAGALSDVLRYLANPQSGPLLLKVFRTWMRGNGRAAHAGSGDTNGSAAKQAVECLRRLKQVEDFLYPLPDRDWLENTDMALSAPEVCTLLEDFRAQVKRWHGAALLPIDQILLTLAQDLFTEPAELAVAHKLAGMLRQKGDANPNLRLPGFTEELDAVANNQRRFLGFSEDDNGFDPEKHRGRVVITTMHKAKGLEWDRVYLLSLNNYDFPSGTPYDTYISEKRFIRGRLNLEAEALEQLKVALDNDPNRWYQEGEATLAARADCVCERLRLLYVGITRARRALVMTWNTGRGDQQPAVPFLELQRFWESQ